MYVEAAVRIHAGPLAHTLRFAWQTCPVCPLSLEGKTLRSRFPNVMDEGRDRDADGQWGWVDQLYIVMEGGRVLASGRGLLGKIKGAFVERASRRRAAHVCCMMRRPGVPHHWGGSGKKKPGGGGCGTR